MSRSARAAAYTAAVVVLFTGGLLVATPTDRATTMANVVDACAAPTSDDHAEAEQYAGCRASELAGVLSSLPPIPTVTATATETATETATQTVTATTTATATVTATATATTTVTASPAPQRTMQIGLSTSSTTWDSELSRLNSGGGITVRRIFISQLSQTGNQQTAQITAALQAGLTPWVSFKVPTLSNPSQYASWVDTTANQWEALAEQYGIDFVGTIWHEANNGDMTAAQYLAMQDALAPHLKRPHVLVAPILTSFQLTNASSADDGQFDNYVDVPRITDGTYSYFGFDSYETPYERVPVVEQHLTALGAADTVQLAVGEWNSTDAAEIQNAVGFLNDPRVAIACFWDSGSYYPLSAARESALKSMLSDPRVQR